MVDYKIHWLKMMSVPESRAVVGRHDGINGRDSQTRYTEFRTLPPSGREGGMMDQAIHNKIVSFIRGIEANLGSRSYITPDSRTLSADAKRSESPRWR